MRPEFIAVLIFGGFTAIALVAMGLANAQSRSAKRRLAAVTDTGEQASRNIANELAPRGDLAPAITNALERARILGDLQVNLLRAGLLLRPSELVALCVGSGMLAAIVVRIITGTMITGALVGAIATAGPYMWMKSRQSKRTRALSAQLPDALDMLSAALRSGFAFQRGLQLIRSQMHPPISEEFGRVVAETQFGVSLEAALDNLVIRTGNYDLELIVSAVQTQLSLGGNLAEILTNIAEMIRERVRLAGEIGAATAEGRMSAGILLAMPFGVGIVISVASPRYLAPLFSQPTGLAMLGGGALLMLLGAVTIKKMIDVDI
jgi:tight adherence protein B